MLELVDCLQAEEWCLVQPLERYYSAYIAEELVVVLLALSIH